MFHVQNVTGINISLVFNNIYIPNDFRTMDQFINNFYDYYKLGVRSVTIPHLLWVMNGKIKKEFPNLYIKSTVLRRVRNAQEFYNYANAGFDCVNVDRLLFRSIDNLKEIKKAQKKIYQKSKKYIPISMILNENCLGYCSFWEEHYQHTMTSKICNQKDKNKEGFRLVCKYSGCNSINNITLKRTNLIYFQEDIDEVFKYIDIIKFGGRRIKFEPFTVIDTLISKKVICHPILHQILIRNKEEEIDLLEKWRNKIKNCFYQCWDCNICDQLDYIINKQKLINTLIKKS